MYYKNEVVTIQQITGIDWTGATYKQFKFVSPTGVATTKTATDVVVDDATTGTVHSVITLTEAGQWLAQARRDVGTTDIRYGPTFDFYVSEPF